MSFPYRPTFCIWCCWGTLQETDEQPLNTFFLGPLWLVKLKNLWLSYWSGCTSSTAVRQKGLYCRWVDWDLEKLKDLPKVPKEGGNTDNIELRNSASFSPCICQEKMLQTGQDTYFPSVLNVFWELNLMNFSGRQSKGSLPAALTSESSVERCCASAPSCANGLQTWPPQWTARPL